MDIKERIDALSEAEAKAALLYTIIELYKLCDCNKCKNLSECKTNDKWCEFILLDRALKEART